MDEETMTFDAWKDYLGIEEEQEEVVSVNDVEGEWENARKF